MDKAGKVKDPIEQIDRKENGQHTVEQGRALGGQKRLLAARSSREPDSIL